MSIHMRCEDFERVETPVERGGLHFDWFQSPALVEPFDIAQVTDHDNGPKDNVKKTNKYPLGRHQPSA